MKHILLPIDGSPCSGLAIQQAKEFAQIYGCRITLLNVYDLTYLTNSIDFNTVPWSQDIVNGMCKKSNEILLEAKELLSGMGDKVELVSLEGNPADQIIEYVRDHHDIDLVIMGSYGMSGFRRFFMGSTTHKVAVAIEKPILII